MTETKTLAEGLVIAQGKARPVGKKGNTNQYKFASSEDIIFEAGQALQAGGLSLFPQTYSVEGSILTVQYVLLHRSGEERLLSSTTPIISTKFMPLDKAMSAAKTYDLNYTLRGLLLLPRGDAFEVDRRDDTRGDSNEVALPGDFRQRLKAAAGTLGKDRAKQLVGDLVNMPNEAKLQALDKLERIARIESAKQGVEVVQEARAF